ncbi:MAG: ferrochelatase [Verrucomicrobia bacterium]|nr:ferrochelatase [Verrucomicrobiota bacterium]
MSQKGLLLVNLGSPASPSVPDVRRYLREFLMDGRVLDAPWPIRFAIVHFAILPKRPAQSAEAYHKIWTAEGSPLIVMGRRVQAELQQRLKLPVELGMRYQEPSIRGALTRLREAGVEEALLIPLFPHYAMSSYETAVLRVQELLPKVAPALRLTVQPPYGDDPDYIKALVGSVAGYLKQDYDHLLFSFHGVPERHLKKSDPTKRHCLTRENCCDEPSPAHATCYRAQCFKTVAAFVRAAGIAKYSIAFQSRLGRDPWLKPYTDVELGRLAARGVKRLLVMCPAFVADCLETIEEIGIRGAETFLEAGGQELVRVPCLNDHPLWIETLEKWARRFTG